MCCVVSVASADEGADRRAADDPGQNEENTRHQTLKGSRKCEYNDLPLEKA